MSDINIVNAVNRVRISTLNEYQASCSIANVKTVYNHIAIRNVQTEVRIFSVEKSKIELSIAIVCAWVNVCVHILRENRVKL